MRNMMNEEMKDMSRESNGLMKFTDAQLLKFSRDEVRALKGVKEENEKLVAKNNLLVAQLEELSARVAELEEKQEVMHQDVRQSEYFLSLKEEHRDLLERNRKQRDVINELLGKLNKLERQMEAAA